MKRRRILQFMLAFLLVIVLGWLLQDFIRRSVALPIMFIVYLIKVAYFLLPQGLIWAAFILILLIIALNSYRQRAAQEPMITSSPKHQAEQRVAMLLRYINQSQRSFYRHRLNHAMTELTLRVIAYRQQIPYQVAKIALASGELELPLVIKDYIQQGLPPWPTKTQTRLGLLAWLFRTEDSAEQARKKSEQILQFLEEQMEVDRKDGNSPVI